MGCYPSPLAKRVDERTRAAATTYRAPDDYETALPLASEQAQRHLRDRRVFDSVQSAPIMILETPLQFKPSDPTQNDAQASYGLQRDARVWNSAKIEQ